MKLYIVCGVQGRMQKYAFLGVRASVADARYDADQYALMMSKPGVVLEAQPGRDGSLEVYRSGGGQGRMPRADPRRARARRRSR